MELQDKHDCSSVPCPEHIESMTMLWEQSQHSLVLVFLQSVTSPVQFVHELQVVQSEILLIVVHSREHLKVEPTVDTWAALECPCVTPNTAGVFHAIFAQAFSCLHLHPRIAGTEA